MRQYIVNLTNNLIGKNRYDTFAVKFSNRDEFLEFVKFDLTSSDVQVMTPKTLGKVMCEFEVGDVLASKEDLFNGLSFSGDCEEMQRELVAACLAYAIILRLDVVRSPGVPAYKHSPILSPRH